MNTFTQHIHDLIAALETRFGKLEDSMKNELHHIFAHHTQAVVNTAAVSGVAAIDPALLEKLNPAPVPPAQS